MPKGKPYSRDAATGICARCKVEFPTTEFYPHVTNKRVSYCRACCKALAAVQYLRHRDKRRAKNKAYANRPENKERQRQRVRDWHYRKNYGLTEEAKRAMESAQGNRCAICRTHFSEMRKQRIHIDHCHATGKIRGILCHHCNQVLGSAKDNDYVLKAALLYLRQYRSSRIAQGADMVA